MVQEKVGECSPSDPHSSSSGGSSRPKEKTQTKPTINKMFSLNTNENLVKTGKTTDQKEKVDTQQPLKRCSA
jgi:hypothetical protein